MFAIRARGGFDGERAFPGAITILVGAGRIRGIEPGWPDIDVEWIEEFPESVVLPGLVDVHVHLGGDGKDGALDRLADLPDDVLDATIADALQRHLAAGVTTVRDLGDRRFSVLEYRRRHASEAGIPTIVAAGPPVTAVRGHCWSMGGEVDGPDDLRAAVQERAERGADLVKVMASGGVMTPGTEVTVCQFTPGEMKLLVEEVHDVGLSVVAHAHGLSAVEQCVEAGVDGIEHFSCLTETGITISDALLETVAAAGIAVDPTMGKAPGAVPPPAVRAIMERFDITWERRQREVGRAHRAGVRLITGTDGGINSGKPHGVLPMAVADFVAGGMPNSAALAAATSVSAEACGLGDRKGRVRAGFDADLILVDGDPLEDIGALQRLEEVFVAGRGLRAI